jgi:hypothetical protein
MLLAIFFLSGYKLPSRIIDAIKGLLTGSLFIFVVYALLPLNLRFSRAIIIIGGLLASLAVPLYRLLVSLLKAGIAENIFTRSRRTVIVSDQQGFSRVLDLLSSTGAHNIIAGRVSIIEDDLTEEVLGSLPQLKEVLRVNRIREVIFTTRNMNASQIINSMHQISDYNITIRIASADEKYLLGSRYISPGDPVKPLIKSIFRKRE